MIQVEDLFKRFGHFEALKYLSFSVGEGESVGLLGENGAGKTTTMRILSCFLPPTSGRVTVAGHDVVFGSAAVRRAIGYMPESVPLYGGMRVEEYLIHRAKLKGVPSRDARAACERAMGRVNMTDRRRSLIQTLSKGLRQRVGLADALVHEPALLILDEPTSGLDPSQRREVRELIRSLRKKHTVLVSTHILPEVEATCDRVVVLNKGVVVAQKSIQEMKSFGDLDHFEVVLRGDEAAARSALARRAELEVREAERLDAGRLAVRCATPDRAHGRSAAVAALVGAGLEILELRSSDMSLEEAFIRLIGRGEAVRA